MYPGENIYLHYLNWTSLPDASYLVSIYVNMIVEFKKKMCFIHKWPLTASQQIHLQISRGNRNLLQKWRKKWP